MFITAYSQRGAVECWRLGGQ